MKRFFLPKILITKTATKLAFFFGFNFPYIIPKNIKIESDSVYSQVLVSEGFPVTSPQLFTSVQESV